MWYISIGHALLTTIFTGVPAPAEPPLFLRHCKHENLYSEALGIFTTGVSAQ